jgi:carboxylesterase
MRLLHIGCADGRPSLEPVTPNLVHPLAAPFRIEGRSGEAFVLVHGFTGNPAHFRPLGRELAERGYTVNAPLLPGHGDTRDALRGVKRTDWIEATKDSIREVGDHRRVHLVGLSMGGLLAVVAATTERVSTLTTINAPIVFRDARIRFSRQLQLVRRDFVPPPEPAPEIDSDVAENWIHTRGFPLAAAAELFDLSRQARRRAPDVSIPSMVIQSRTDDTTHPRSGPRLRAALGGAARLRWLEHSIHNALFDRERDVIRDTVLEMSGT